MSVAEGLDQRQILNVTHIERLPVTHHIHPVRQELSSV